MARGAAGWQAHYEHAPIVPAGPNTWIAGRAGEGPGRALDLACGAGRHAVWLAEHGWSVTAVDIAPAAIERTSATADAAGVAVDARTGDAATWMPEPGTDRFDLVVIAFFHVLGRLRRLNDLVRPGGSLLLVCHARDSPVGPTDPALRPTPADVVAALPAGWTVETAETVSQIADDGVNGADVQAVHVHVHATRPDTAGPAS